MNIHCTQPLTCMYTLVCSLHTPKLFTRHNPYTYTPYTHIPIPPHSYIHTHVHSHTCTHLRDHSHAPYTLTSSLHTNIHSSRSPPFLPYGRAGEVVIPQKSGGGWLRAEGNHSLKGAAVPISCPHVSLWAMKIMMEMSTVKCWRLERMGCFTLYWND